MKEIIDEMIKENAVDYEKYFNEHIHDEIYSAEYFDKFLEEFPRTNVLYMDKVTDLLDVEFDKYLLSQLFYTGKNKVKIYNTIRKLLDFREDYVDIYKQFMDIQSVILDVIREIGLYEEENR